MSSPTSRGRGFPPPAEDSWALVTGASSGIGAQFARALAARGYNLLLTGRREEALAQVAREISSPGRQVESVLAELSRPSEVERILERCAGRRVDALVNNAGFGLGRAFLDEPFESQERMERVHVWAPMRLIHELAPRMVARGSGAIINVASLAAFLPMPTSAMYAATKTFLRLFSESLAVELWASGVRVQVLCPGFTRTRFHAGLRAPEQQLGNRFLVHWMDPPAVVRASLDALDRNRVVCVPGFWNRVIRSLIPLIPRRLFYRLAASRV